jgi:hypothetical protein
MDRARRRSRRSAVIVTLVAAACAEPPNGPVVSERDELQVVWRIDAIDSIGDHETTVLGSPRVIDDPGGLAVEFDGVQDGLQVAAHPLEGANEFTAEVVFRPYPAGPREQRFLHLQEDGSKDRLLFEIRMFSSDRWFLDTHIESRDDGYTLFARGFEHPVGPWYHAALVVTGGEMKHYVNGELEMSRKIEFAPQGPGHTSVGVRLNLVSWFKGAIREARFTRRVLAPEEFSIPEAGP